MDDKTLTQDELINDEKPSIFKEQISRKPDRYPWTKQLKTAMWDGHWTADDFDFASDIQDFKVRMTDQEREMTIRVLSAIGQIETGVKQYWSKLGENLPNPSIIDLGLVMAGVEVIHNDAYEKLLDVLHIEDIFQENLKLDIIANRVKYLRKYSHRYNSDSKKQFLYSLILFTLFVENVSLFSQFYVISWFKKNKNYMNDAAQQVRYTRQEETIHALSGIMLINEIRKEHPELFDEELKEKILHEAESAFEAEAKIIDWFLNGYDHPSLNPAVLKEYTKDRINESLVPIGYPRIFEIDEKLMEQTLWAEEQSIGNVMTDFFAGRPVEYQRRKFTEFDVFGDEGVTE
jgi:ribonucleoside-diphosphate reductase beta chain